jgi:uncharacterized protein YlzI (FlbEa/FlbD family)
MWSCIGEFVSKLYVDNEKIEQIKLLRRRKIVLLNEVKYIVRKIVNNAEVIDLYGENNKKLLRIHTIYKNAIRFEAIVNKCRWRVRGQ